MSRVIRAEDVTAAAAWSPARVDQASLTAPEGPRLAGGVVTAGVLEDLQREAYEEAYEQGRREGYAAGRERGRAEVERLSQLLTDLARPLEQLDGEVERELVALAIALARQLVRRELRQDPTQIIGIVREAIGKLPVASRDVRVQLHPEDAAVVREHLAETQHERAWTLVEDPMMMRGGCQVLTATSRVDARLDVRLGALLAEIMGDERDGDARGGE